MPKKFYDIVSRLESLAKQAAYLMRLKKKKSFFFKSRPKHNVKKRFRNKQACLSLASFYSQM
jgi:hypothetical protein